MQAHLPADHSGCKADMLMVECDDDEVIGEAEVNVAMSEGACT
jgi:hypothetical protein